MTPRKNLAAGLLLSITSLCLSPTALADDTVNPLLQSLQQSSEQNLQLHSVPESAYHLLRATGNAPLLLDQVDAAPTERALRFLQQYGELLDISDASSQLQLLRVTTDRAGQQHVHLSQQQNGLPVFGSRLVVHMNKAGIQGVSGSFVSGLENVSRTPALTAAELQSRARKRMQKDNPQAELQLESQRLMYYRSGVLKGVPGNNYLAQEVVLRSSNGQLRERFILDAQTGALINRINEIHSIKNRAIYTPNQDVPPIITEGSVTAPADIALSGDGPSTPASRLPRAPQNNLYIFAGGTYDLYKNLFGREGYDDGALPAEEQIQKSVYLINDQCPNAYWNGDSTNYCPGFDADDVVSHEWSHAYTEYTHGLIYQYQSGALNESYSDIFGEVYDLVNGIEGPLGVSLTEGEYFENGGSRWVVGEDLSEVAAAVLLRDMWDPDNFGINLPQTGFQVLNTGSPGSVISSENYYCESGDGGGVHTNSAVPNHAFAMLVDGKTFNDVEIPAIGMTRAVHVYFHAALHYQTPTTNFAQHADALAQSCSDLIGVPLTDVLGQPSADVIDSNTCAAIEAAMLAVEMRQNPAEKCDYQPLLEREANTPDLCPAGSGPVADFSQDWEASSSLPEGWTSTENLGGDTSEGTVWEIVSDLPNGHSGQAAFVINSSGGSCAPGGDISASFQLDSPEISVINDASVFSMSHLMQSEFAFDGGNLKISINGGDFTLVPADAFSWNPYNTTLETGGAAPVPDPTGTTGGGNTSPIAGQAAWSGSDEGESFSSWGVSHVDLSTLGVVAGDSVRFRFEFGQDGCAGNLGWYVDDISLNHCVVGQSNDNGVPDTAGVSGSDVDTNEDGDGVSAPPATANGNRGGALGGSILLAMILLGLRRSR